MAEGRRQRVKDRVRNEGIDSFYPHEILELMLYPYVPRKDTKPIAVKLLETFGNLDGVFNASERELSEVEGMPKGAAFHFPLYYQVTARAKCEKLERETVINNFNQASEYICEKIGYLPYEEFIVICLDVKKRVTRTKKFSSKEVIKAELNLRNIVDFVLGAKSVAVVIGHNHPSGDLTPSLNDIKTTEALANMFGGLGITLFDHIIVSKSNGYSIRLENKTEKALPFAAVGENW